MAAGQLDASLHQSVGRAGLKSGLNQGCGMAQTRTSSSAEVSALRGAFEGPLGLPSLSAWVLTLIRNAGASPRVGLHRALPSLSWATSVVVKYCKGNTIPLGQVCACAVISVALNLSSWLTQEALRLTGLGQGHLGGGEFDTKHPFLAPKGAEGYAGVKKEKKKPLYCTR